MALLMLMQHNQVPRPLSTCELANQRQFVSDYPFELARNVAGGHNPDVHANHPQSDEGKIRNIKWHQLPWIFVLVGT